MSIYATELESDIIEALKSHAQGHIDKHKMNVKIYLENPAGIGEHSDIVDAIEHELMEMAKYDDQLEMIEKYFK